MIQLVRSLWQKIDDHVTGGDVAQEKVRRRHSRHMYGISLVLPEWRGRGYEPAEGVEDVRPRLRLKAIGPTHVVAADAVQHAQALNP